MFNIFHYCRNYQNTYFLVTCLFCLGIIITSLEYIFIRKEFKTKGVFSWQIFSSRSNYLNSPLPLRKFNFLFGYTGVLTIHLIRIACASILPFITDYTLKVFLLGLIVFVSLIFSFRTIIGNDGSDQMYSIISITLLIVFACNDTFIYKIGLIFIACQSIIAYLVAGIAKVVSKKWRSGIAVYQIMNTKTYGNRKIAMFLHKSSKPINYIISWHIILFETLFVFVVFLPFPWSLIFIVWGIGFHLYNAITMGLNNFFWAFISTYPSLLFLQHLIVR